MQVMPTCRACSYIEHRPRIAAYAQVHSLLASTAEKHPRLGGRYDAFFSLPPTRRGTRGMRKLTRLVGGLPLKQTTTRRSNRRPLGLLFTGRRRSILDASIADGRQSPRREEIDDHFLRGQINAGRASCVALFCITLFSDSLIGL